MKLSAFRGRHFARPSRSLVAQAFWLVLCAAFFPPDMETLIASTLAREARSRTFLPALTSSRSEEGKGLEGQSG